MGNPNDHNFFSIVLSISLLGLGFLGFMGRSWVNHVNTSIKELWIKFETINGERERRWENLEHRCEAHTERITWVEAKINGKNSKAAEV